LGRWDGCIRFCDIGGRTNINILDKLLPIVSSSGYEIQVEDHRIPHVFEFEEITATSYSNIKWPPKHKFENQPITVMDHQVEAINLYLKNPQSIQQLPTASGKTLITAILSNKIEPYGRSIVIVPSKDLVTQTEEMYAHIGLDVGVFYGDRKEFGKTHTICTWQSLEVLNKKSKKYDENFNIQDFIEGVICVIVDESHGLGADVLRKLMTTVFANVPIRWGMTGTIPKEEADALCLVATVGPIINSIKATTLQQQGKLANLHIDILQLQDNIKQFNSFADEYKYTTTSDQVLNLLADHVSQVSQSGNTLVLVNRIESGKVLHGLLPGSVFISGSVKSKERKQEYQSVQQATNKIIIATYGVAAVGIDIPRIFNLYLFEPGKSFIRVIQSIGRGIRTAKDKTSVQVYDVCSNHKYSKRHLTERKRFYKEQGYPFTVNKVQL
jgi:superfamily II DNA or RNA helicase